MFLRKIISLYKKQVEIDEGSIQKYKYSLRKRTLFYFLCIIIITNIILWFVTCFYFKSDIIILCSFLGSAFLAMAALFFNLKGKIDLSSGITIITVLGAILVNLVAVNGIHNVGITAIPVFILISGILFRKAIILFITFISVVSIVFVAILEVNGYINTPYSSKVFDDTIVSIILVITCSYIIWIVLSNREQMINIIEKKLKELEVAMEELAAQNEELEAQNEELLIAHNECVCNEHKLRKSLNEKEVLLKEVHHRVKNNMQIICSLMSLQCDEINNDEACEILNSCKQRIRSMSLVHEKLYESDDLSFIDLKLYLDELIKEYERSDGLFSGVTVKLDIKNIFLTIDHAIPLGLIINELLINSIKHAFDNKKTGKIEIKGKKEKNDFLITVKDNGKGISKNLDIDKIETLGLKLVSILTKQLNGKVEIKTNKGTQFILQFPSE